MKHLFFPAKKQKDHNLAFITPLTFSDATALALLHDRCFGLGWDKASFQNFLQDPQFFGFAARKIGSYKQILGFVLIRFVLNEAELISLAVDETYRNQSIGYKLLSQTMRYLDKRDIHKFFLEVDEHNEAAQMLYKKLNFVNIGKRKGYYTLPKHQQKKPSDALIFCYDFTHKNKNLKFIS